MSALMRRIVERRGPQWNQTLGAGATRKTTATAMAILKDSH
jgi:hypothetical protein